MRWRPGARIGTSSLRRAAQIGAVRDDLEVVEIRGNVDTRLRKLAERRGRRARAGAARDCGDSGASTRRPASWTSSYRPPGKARWRWRAASGHLDPEALSELRDPDATVCVFAERELTRALEASCNTPVGAHARTLGDGLIELRAWVGLPDGSAWCSDVVQGEPEGLGVLVAQRLLAAGAGELLREADRRQAG